MLNQEVQKWGKWLPMFTAIYIAFEMNGANCSLFLMQQVNRKNIQPDSFLESVKTKEFSIFSIDVSPFHNGRASSSSQKEAFLIFTF